VNIYKPPFKLPTDTKRSLFLAGSIEMGKAEDWQSKVQDKLMDFDINILNPRRDTWDNSLVQSINTPQFKEQVTWELDGLGSATWIIMYLAPNTISPISLLELGLMASKSNIYVVCPDGFFRKGNVEIVCERYGISLHDNLDELIGIFVNSLKRLEGK
jgi:hypothetical protein